jgi:hypothetical protein
MHPGTLEHYPNEKTRQFHHGVYKWTCCNSIDLCRFENLPKTVAEQVSIDDRFFVHNEQPDPHTKIMAFCRYPRIQGCKPCACRSQQYSGNVLLQQEAFLKDVRQNALYDRDP